MARITRLAFALTAVFTLSGTLKPTPADTPRTPVLVELFTSEGCSSCPPADALLSTLVHRQPVSGAEVIALGEHVDYWDGGGWRDPFSSHTVTARQNDYATSFHNNTVYTPQMVVDGRTEFVGSDDAKAFDTIARAARQPKAQVTIAPGTQPDTFTVTISHLPALASHDSADVYLAVTQNNLVSHVRGGENAGRTLTHVAVVRSLQPLGTARAGMPFSVQAHIPAPAGKSENHRNIVVFIQARDSRRVLGAAIAAG